MRIMVWELPLGRWYHFLGHSIKGIQVLRENCMFKKILIQNVRSNISFSYMMTVIATYLQYRNIF